MKRHKAQYPTPKIPSKRGRPRKYIAVEEHPDDEQILVRTIQQAPYNTGAAKSDWLELRGRIRAYMVEEKRMGLSNALFILLTSALNAHEEKRGLVAE